MTFWRLYYHLVWATDQRLPLITEQVEPRLYSFIVSKAAELQVYVYAIGGWHDHTHLVVACPPTLAIATLVQRLKGASSHYVNSEFHPERAFAWQRGYGALTVGERHRSVAEAYVKQQKQHHAHQSTIVALEQVEDEPAGPHDPMEPRRMIREYREEYQGIPF